MRDESFDKKKDNVSGVVITERKYDGNDTITIYSKSNMETTYKYRGVKGIVP